MKDTQEKLDSRVRHSREALFNALFALMMERGYERLTIQNLLDRADVGRATFYAHFDSKDELLAGSVARLRDWLIGEWRQLPEQRLGFTLPLFQHLASHSAIYQKSIARESEVSVERHMRQMLHGLVRDDLASRMAPGKGSASLDLAVQFVTGALWSTIAWWMASAMAVPPPELNALFQRLAFPGLEVTLGEVL
jgi:AcrR family transcriptional regulator